MQKIRSPPFRKFNNKIYRNGEMRVKKGLEMTRDSLIRALNEEGVEEVVVENFDHNLHMAVQTLPADEEHPADSIAQVLQKGYKLHERLLRPAMVVVYS